MMFDKDTLLKEVMAADFTVIDLNLYLDTHPCDACAINLYNQAIQRAITLRAEYEKLCGPLTAYNSFTTAPYQWIKSPWPWEGR